MYLKKAFFKERYQIKVFLMPSFETFTNILKYTFYLLVARTVIILFSRSRKRSKQTAVVRVRVEAQAVAGVRVAA